MSHLDELDDYEAELELRLKKEYSAVYTLFRYCVLTQDGNYLCNKLDMQYVPQAVLPVLPAEDGGRLGLGQEPADADDPAGRGVDLRRRHGRGAARRGDEPAFTAEALAKRMSEPRPRRRDEQLAPPRADPATMLLAIDVGNTQTVFGLFEGERARRAVPGRDEPRADRATSSPSCCGR